MSIFPRWRDKALIALNRMLRVALFLIRFRRLIAPHSRAYPLLLWDTMANTPYGTFFCRKRTVDFEIVSPVHEPELRQWFAITKGTFVDVGAHIGRYTVMVAKTLGINGKVIACEPSPDTFSALMRNIRVNNLSNVTALNLAVGDRDGTGILYFHGTDPILHSLVRKAANSVPVTIRTLDSLLSELKIDDLKLVKIDVEGAEMLVLRGAKETLQKYHPLTVIVEVTDSTERDVTTFLQQFGFNIISRVGFPYNLVASK